MSRESIIERIRKLLAMTEHDVSSSELHGSSDDEPIEHVASDAARRYRQWGSALAVVVADALRCKTYGDHVHSKRYYQMLFIGHSSDAKAAAIVFDRLYRVGCDLGNIERRRARDAERAGGLAERVSGKRAQAAAGDATARAYESFTWGFFDGVKSELEKQSVVLMIVAPSDVVEEFESMLLGEGRVAARREDMDGARYERGRDAGRDAVRAGLIGKESGCFALGA